MEILEAFDLAGSLRGAAELAGCDHKTVAHWVRVRDEAGGGLPVAARRRPMVDGFAGKIEELVDRWLTRAAAAGASRVRRKMAEAVDLAKLHGTQDVEYALSVCAQVGRFGEGDLALILAHQSTGRVIPFPARTSEDQTLQRSTAAWDRFGR